MAPSTLPTPDEWAQLLRACAAGTLAQVTEAPQVPIPALLDLAPAPTDGEPYGRRPLYRGPEGEVLLVRWREDTFCAPHDHGAAGGSIRLLRGRFVERRWAWVDGELRVAGEQRHAAPGLLALEPGLIHDMKAEGDAAGLHFYVPAIVAMRVYDRERRETLIVSEDCGAWIPRDPSLVLSRAAW